MAIKMHYCADYNVTYNIKNNHTTTSIMYDHNRIS